MTDSQKLTRLDVIAAISLANLFLLEVWRKLIFVTKFFVPYWSWRDLISAALLVCIFSTVFILIIACSRHSRFHHLMLHRFLYLAPLALILNFARRHELVNIRVDLGDARLLLMGSGLAILLTAAFLRWHQRVLRVAEVLVIGLIGFAPVTFGQAVRATLFSPPAYELAAFLPDRPAHAPRVVWIIFDEMDWRYSYGPRRASTFSMPAFDRLKSESFYGATAHQAGLNTITAMPSLITGETVYRSTAQSYDSLMLQFQFGEGGRETDFKDTETIFSSARNAGVNVGVVGWYLPYCRIFSTVLSECMWESLNTVVRGTEPNLRTSFTSQLRTLSPAETRQRHIVRYSDMMSRAKMMIVDPRLGLILLHMPVPHGPLMYDRVRGELAAFTFSRNWYLDNLALTDRALGELRQSLEDAGMWDTTTILVSADHAMRRYSNINETMDSRVPFLLKMAGQRAEFEYTAPFHALITHDLILTILEGKLTQPQQVADWISTRERRHPSMTQTAQAVRSSSPSD